MLRNCYGLPLAAGLAIATVPAAAHATWSIAAVDPETGQVGVAVASCVEAPFGTTLLPRVIGLAPGVGALAAQAQLNQQTRDFAVELLTDGIAPAEVIAMVNARDGAAQTRQYGVVTLDGQTATFTGSSTMAWAGDLQGDGMTAQGNILYGPQVVDDAFAAFSIQTERCPLTLADRLMAALEAGAAQGGDQRCSMRQSALGAVIMVANPDDSADAPMLSLAIPSQPPGGDNPVALLRAAYDTWRQDNPPSDRGCSAGSSSDGGLATDTGAVPDSTGAPAGDGSEGPAQNTSGAGGTTMPGTTAPASATGAAGATGLPAANTSDPSGCGCRGPARTRPPGAAVWLALIGVWGLGRRKRQAAKHGQG